MLLGLVIASQLAWPNLFYFADLGWLNFGRLRPLHTSGVIFAFDGNVLIATPFYVVQRTCKAHHSRRCCRSGNNRRSGSTRSFRSRPYRSGSG
jgi:cbb3-type cytochrome oxidase subunit 1